MQVYILVIFMVLQLHCSWMTVKRFMCGRMVQLVSIIMEADAAGNLIEDYASCLEARAQDFQAPENPNEDSGFLILQLLINNLSRPAPNVSHLLLRFDVDVPVERSILQPKWHYSCLRIILNILETYRSKKKEQKHSSDRDKRGWGYLEEQSLPFLIQQTTQM